MANIKPKEPIFLYDIFETVVTSIVVFLVVYAFLAFPEVVKGASMEPTLYTGERILIERVTKNFQGFQRGDIVVLHPPGNDNEDYVKRIIGLPGDIVKIEGCRIYITNEEGKFMLDESYLYDGTCTVGKNSVKDNRSIRIDEGHYMLLGDNRNVSLDSRRFGFISEDRILGKLVVRFWPLNKFKIF